MQTAEQPTLTYPAGGRKKGVEVRPWLALDSSGQTQITKDGKHDIMRRTGLLGRDLRILDPILSHPSTVLGRERAIVINLEYIKAIITGEEVLLPDFKDPSVTPFIDELQKRILCHHHTTKPQEDENSEGEAHKRSDPSQGEAETPQSSGDPGSEAKKDGKQSHENRDGSKVLPFEFVVLEACLEVASSSLECEAERLVLETHPALDKLTSKISNLSLERVRQIKSRLVVITGRVQKVKDVLEHLLDNNEDMAEMYLTEKLALENSLNSSMNETDATEFDDLPEEDEDDRNSRGTHTSPTRSVMTNKLDVKELEMILEAYFVHIDGTLNKLSTLREYVDDTDDYIKIMLDGNQNKLLQLGVKLTLGTLLMSFSIAAASVFGMNISIELFTNEKAGPVRFWWTVFGLIIGPLSLYAGAIWWWKNKRLL